MSAGLAIRTLAAEVLHRVEREGAYANRALDAALARAGPDLAPADRRLATELVYGALRFRAALDFALGRAASRRLKDVDPGLLRLLRLAAYELLYLDRVPAHATVHTAVAAARAGGGERWARFANGVLRTLDRERAALPWPRWEDDPLAHLTVVGSHPRWLAALLLDQLGDEARDLVAASNRPAPVVVRATRRAAATGDQEARRVAGDASSTARLTAARDTLAARLAAAGVAAHPGQAAPGALVLEHTGAVAELDAFAAGELAVQDEASQLVVHLLDPRPGEAVLDVCAAPGGKSCLAAELMDDRGRVDALDLHASKVRAIAQTAARLGLSSVHAAVADGTAPLPPRPDAPEGVGYDAVLVDAPCANTGTLRRHPERRWSLEPDALPRLAALQGRLLDSAAGAVRPGGRLVYAVCSVTREEGEEVVAGLLARHPDFTPTPTLDRDPLSWQPWLTPDGAVRTWPHRHGLDGFFMQRFRRAEDP